LGQITFSVPGSEPSGGSSHGVHIVCGQVQLTTVHGGSEGEGDVVHLAEADQIAVWGMLRYELYELGNKHHICAGCGTVLGHSVDWWSDLVGRLVKIHAKRDLVEWLAER